jgi:hypothetical protein
MKLKSVVRVFCALAIGLLPGVAHAQQHSTGSYIQVVNQGSGTVSLASSPNPSGYTQTVTLTATLPTGATGTVSFYDGTTQINGPVTIATGATTASTATSTLSLGTHSITATYSGDKNYTTATSAPISQVVGKGTTGLSLASSGSPSTYGSGVTFTATLAVGTTGSVTFYDNGVLIGSQTINAAGVASYPTTTLTVGTHPITAQYAGDSNFTAPPTSNTVSQVVNPDSTTKPVLTNVPSTATYGTTTVRFTATMPATASGVVTFLDSVTGSIGTGTLTGGVATLPINNLPVGIHQITASYPGDSNFAASVSNQVTETITQQTGETISLASNNNPAAFSTAVTFTATVPSDAKGTVTFYDNGVSIGTGSVNAGIATFQTSILAVGTHPITATYGGDTNYSSVTTTAGVSQSITQGTATVSISGAPNPSSYGAGVLMTITVTGQNSVIPTGTVTLTDNGNPLGTGPLPLNASGQATYSTSALTSGNHTIVATYNGDTTYK